MIWYDSSWKTVSFRQANETTNEIFRSVNSEVWPYSHIWRIVVNHNRIGSADIEFQVIAFAPCRQACSTTNMECTDIDVNCNWCDIQRRGRNSSYDHKPPPHLVYLPGPLKVVVPTESVSSYLGDTALLRCEVSGDPTPVIRWQKNREDLPLTYDPDSRLATLPSGSLQVSRVQPPDSATYRCLADNPGSTRTGSDAELRVLPGNGTELYTDWSIGKQTCSFEVQSNQSNQFITKSLCLKGQLNPKYLKVSGTLRYLAYYNSLGAAWVFSALKIICHEIFNVLEILSMLSAFETGT